MLREHHGQPFTTATLQAIAADLVGARTELLLPLKDLVSRPGFQQLIAKAGSGSGGVELRALLADLEMTFTPALINALEEVLNGFLDLPTADGSTTTQRFAETTPLLVFRRRNGKTNTAKRTDFSSTISTTSSTNRTQDR